MNIFFLLNTLNFLAAVLICAGVFLNFGLGWALIIGGTYLAFNVITTVKALNVSNPED